VLNPDFFAVFVRNHRLPIIKVEMEDPSTVRREGGREGGEYTF